MSAQTLALFGGTPVLTTPYSWYYAIEQEEKDAVARVMDTQVLSDFIGRAGDKFLGGKEVRAFEQAMCKKFGTAHAVSFNSATTALQAAVAALGIGPGDEVITTPFTMSATASAILLNSAVPVFADIDEQTYCLDPKSVEARITPRTKAILSVNIFGGSADYDALVKIARAHGLPIIEDNAQSIGATYKEKYLGTIGDIGVFSFNVHKHLQCGEGGVLVTDNDALAFRAQLVRNHGEVVIDDLSRADGTYEPIIGSNYRLSELHAAVAHEQLKKMDIMNERRVALADYLTERLRVFPWLRGVTMQPYGTHVYYVYPFTFDEARVGFSRAAFAAAMKAEGFPLNVGYLTPLHLMPMYQKKRMFARTQFPFVSQEFPTDVSYEKGICPVAERMWEKEFLFTALCHYPLTTKEIDLFIYALEKVAVARDALAGYIPPQSQSPITKRTS